MHGTDLRTGAEFRNECRNAALAAGRATGWSTTAGRAAGALAAVYVGRFSFRPPRRCSMSAVTVLSISCAGPASLQPGYLHWREQGSGVRKSRPKADSRSYAERNNLNVRMHSRRMTRLTNAFSKKIDNHYYALALHFLYQFRQGAPNAQGEPRNGCRRNEAPLRDERRSRNA